VTAPGSDRIAVLVHEVRSSVAALAAIAEALSDADDASARVELTRLALGACAAIERIVSDISVASVRPEPVDIGALVRDVVGARVVAGGHVGVDVEADLPLVEADPIRIRQALDNLVANALVHGGGRDLVVGAIRSVGGVSLTVADEGPGIALVDLERIFDRGVRLDETKPGSGLGLAVTRAIVEAHGGTIEVDSTVGQGTVFTITLRASQSDT
jgi:signal transduction histidine kinase